MENYRTDEYIALFISECEKLLALFDKIIMESDALDELSDQSELFRVLHTLKGSSAMMDYTPLVDLSHRFENVLTRIKNDGILPRGKTLQEIIDAGIAFSAYFRAELASIRLGEPVSADRALGTKLDKMAGEGNAQSASVRSEPEADGKSVRLKVTLRECPMPHIRAFLVARSVKGLCSYLVTKPEKLDTLINHDESILKNGFEIHFIPLADSESVIKKVSVQPYVEACSKQGCKKSAEDAPLEARTAGSVSIMLPQETINKLVHFIDELTYEEGMLESHLEKSGETGAKTRELLSSLRHTVRDVGVLASEIGSRSIESVFMAMQITVRNMAREMDKKIKTKLYGSDITVDKSVLEILSDCLIHIVRNAADHGIENPAERLSLGKPETGTISISAERKNDYLTVTISDDGRGIRTREVLDRAEKEGLLTKQRQMYTNAEINNLLFVSGVSTTESVTKYSGRGVGLDTVLRRIKQVGGIVTAESTEGEGSVFKLKIPITLTAVDGIEITTNGGRHLIVPTRAIRSISHEDSFDASGVIRWSGADYHPLCFPDEEYQENPRDGYILFLSPDFGLYYLYIRRISTIASYYVKQLPECISDKLGRRSVFSGCVLCADSKLRCVLDAEKLIALRAEDRPAVFGCDYGE